MPLFLRFSAMTLCAVLFQACTVTISNGEPSSNPPQPMTCNQLLDEGINSWTRIRLLGGDNKPVCWTSRVVFFEVNYQSLIDAYPEIDLEQAKSSMARSFAVWNEVPGSDFEFRERAPTTETLTNADLEGIDIADGINRIVWLTPDEWDSKPGTRNADDRVIAKTIHRFDPRTGNLSDADIVANLRRGWSVSDAGETGKFDLQSVMTHELGHALGIDHTAVQSSIMSCTADEENFNNRVTNAEDREALSTIYPTGMPCLRDQVQVVQREILAEPDCQASVVTGKQAHTPWTLILLSLLGLLTWRRQRTLS